MEEVADAKIQESNGESTASELKPSAPEASEMGEGASPHENLNGTKENVSIEKSTGSEIQNSSSAKGSKGTLLGNESRKSMSATGKSIELAINEPAKIDSGDMEDVEGKEASKYSITKGEIEENIEKIVGAEIRKSTSSKSRSEELADIDVTESMEILDIDSSEEKIPDSDKKIQTDILADKIEEWLSWDKNPVTHGMIKDMKVKKENDLLAELLLGRLEFGTAGLRGPMGPGYTRMNDLVIIQTTQGLCSYLVSTLKIPDTPSGSGDSVSSETSTGSWTKMGEKSIAIGYDGRYNSKRFAELATTIFLNEGFIVYLFSEMVPTPFVPYCVSYYKCLAGIMITASHNPKDDNGYKLYWNNGAQIIPPHDKHIQTAILANLQPWERSWDSSRVMQTDQLRDPLAEVMSQYYSTLTDNSLDPVINHKSPVKITYTPMHGVGFRYMKAAFKAANFQDFKAVGLQKFPDPEFPTVKFPNPEEGKSALDCAIATAEEWGSSVILANDPDADRLAAAEQNDPAGAWRIYTGNELGALLGWWSFHVWAMAHKGQSREDLYMLGSTVSTKFLQTLAKAEGFNFVETLTGFKWMGNRAYELKEAGKTVLFAFEEAIGFMYGTAVLDKDGISAGIFVAEMLAHLSLENLTLEGKLEQLYAEYGHHISNNSYFLCFDPKVLKKLFHRLRTFKDGEPGTYPDSILDGKYEITTIRDLTTGYDSAQPDNVAILPTSSSSQMITFTFANGLVTTLRTSGTEPKVKYYTELCASPAESNVDRLKETLQEMVDAIIREFLQPDVNKLVAREP